MPKADKPAMKDNRGGFFAVDRRAWHLVCDLGMNSAAAYLVAARGTGGDNRTTKWSTNAIEVRTGISRSRAREAIGTLERAGAMVRDPSSKPKFPKYKLVPAHEIKACEGYPPAVLDAEHQRVQAAITGEWTYVPESIPARAPNSEYKRWRSGAPRRAAERLVREERAEAHQNGQHFRAIIYDADAAARPNWIWLPNALVDGAANEPSPIELVRQTGSAVTLRLLVNLYGAQNLEEDGGIHFRHIRQLYDRHKVGEHGPFVIWGFVPGSLHVYRSASFVAPQLAAANDEPKLAAGWKEFWDCWNRLDNLGLVEFVGHLVHADSAEGEIIHPVAHQGTGLEIERQLGEAALRAGKAMITPGQQDWAANQGMKMLAPVYRHIEAVQMVGIARLRYRPRTNPTLAFMARENEWREVLDRLYEMANAPLAISR